MHIGQQLTTESLMVYLPLMEFYLIMRDLEEAKLLLLEKLQEL